MHGRVGGKREEAPTDKRGVSRGFMMSLQKKGNSNQWVSFFNLNFKTFSWVRCEECPFGAFTDQLKILTNPSVIH